MASSIPATDFTLTIGARYSVDQSSSEASEALSSKPMVLSQHLISHSASDREPTSLGTNEEVMAVLTMLKEKYDNLTGATKTAKNEAKLNAEAKKAEEEQLMRTAAATTAIASGLHQMFSESATAEDKMKALLSTLGQLISIAAPGGAGALGGSLLQAFTGFIGHTGGLIQDTGIQRFATGGMVQGGDNVPILAQSGEFIMQRSAVNSIGLQNLAQMNNGAQPTSAFTINIAGDMVGDEDHVRTKVLPAIKEELRREANA